jgi:hypothetical protein
MKRLSFLSNVYRNYYKTIISATITAIFILSSNATYAALINSGFETGDFTGWSTIGDASVRDVTSGINPIQGIYSAIINVEDGEPPLTPLPNPISGNDPISGNNEVSLDLIDSFLGLPSGSSEGLKIIAGPSAFGDYAGSAIKQTITASAGQIISFDYKFLTSENPDEAFFNDFAFFSLVDSGGGFITSYLADTFTKPLNTSGSAYYNLESDLLNFSYIIPSSGTYTLGFAVVDVEDLDQHSGLLVDNISSVPIPPALWLFGSGLLGLAGMARRKKA